MESKITAYGQTRKGTEREQNQDAWHANTEDGVFIVADGMGGHAGGSTASRLAVEALSSIMRRVPTGSIATEIRNSFHEAEQRITTEGESNPSLTGMGTTATMLVMIGRMAHIGHLGDSRAYLLRKGHLLQLTVDHTIGEALGAPADSPMHNVLHAGLGRGHDHEVEIMAYSNEYQAGDRYLLTSDGVDKVLTEQDLERLLSQGNTPEEVFKAIMAELEGKATDDHTVVVVFVD